MPPAARVLLRAVALCGCALLAFLTVPNHSPTLLWRWPHPVLLQLLLALPAAWLLLKVAAGRPAGRSGFDPGALTGIALACMASIAAALAGPFREFSTELLPLWIGPLSLMLAIGRATPGRDDGDDAAAAIANTVAGGLLLLCALSLLWWLAADVLGGWLRSDGRPALQLIAIRNERPLGHSNYTAGVALLALGWCGGLAAMTAGPRRRLWIAGAGVGLATVFSSGSRGAWMGVAALAAAAVWFRMVRRGANRRRIAAGVAAVALGTVALAFVHPRTRALLGSLHETGTLNSGDVQRYSMTQAALRMTADRPLLGHGPGATPLVYPRYRAGLRGGVETALQLHNTPLHILAETGLAGLAGALLLAALVGARLRRESREPGVSIAACAAIAFTGYAVFSITDFQLDVPVIGAAVAATAALALRSRNKPSDCGPGFMPDIDAPQVGDKPRPTFGSVGISSVATMLAVAAWLFLVAWTQPGYLKTRARYSAAIDALERADFAKFRSLATGGPGFSIPPGPILNSVALIVADPAAYGVAGSPDPAAAIDLLRTSLGANPDQETAHFNLGLLLLRSDPAAAAAHFREAARLVPDKGGVYLHLSSALLAQGRVEGALTALAVELASDPAFCLSPLWSTPALQPARGAALLKAARLLDPLTDEAPAAGFVAALFRALAGDDSQLDTAESLAPGAARALLGELRDGGAWRTEFTPAIASAVVIRRQRTAYPLLMRNADMPAPIDLAPVMLPPPATRRLSTLFPAKGWLSGPQLRMLLGRDQKTADRGTSDPELSTTDYTDEQG